MEQTGTHRIYEITESLNPRIWRRIDELSKKEEVDLRVDKTLAHLRPVEFGVFLPVRTCLALDCSCMDHSLLLFRQPWDFSRCSEKKETNDADENGKSAQEEGYTIFEPLVSEDL
jgi:hypothetical protein